MVDEEGKPLRNKFNQYKVAHGDLEVRLGSKIMEPFPLYPSEVLKEVSLVVNISQLCQRIT